MEYIYTLGDIVLKCSIDRGEIDRFDSMNGHYTEPGQCFIESVTHKGVDITVLLSDEALSDILESFTNEQNENLTPYFGDIKGFLNTKLSIRK
jgi:hypothetical protein